MSLQLNVPLAMSLQSESKLYKAKNASGVEPPAPMTSEKFDDSSAGSSCVVKVSLHLVDNESSAIN